MARKVVFFSVTDKNRDTGKTFQLTELDSESAERWANKLIFAVANAGIELPDGFQGGGMSAVASLIMSFGLNALAKVPFHVAEPLLAEMFSCVKIKTDMAVRDLITDDIEEVTTRWQLRREIFKLHVNFSMNADPSTPG